MKIWFAVSAISCAAQAADAVRPLQLHEDLAVDPAKEKESGARSFTTLQAIHSEGYGGTFKQNLGFRASILDVVLRSSRWRATMEHCPRMMARTCAS